MHPVVSPSPMAPGTTSWGSPLLIMGFIVFFSSDWCMPISGPRPMLRLHGLRTLPGYRTSVADALARCGCVGGLRPVAMAVRVRCAVRAPLAPWMPVRMASPDSGWPGAYYGPALPSTQPRAVDSSQCAVADGDAAWRCRYVSFLAASSGECDPSQVRLPSTGPRPSPTRPARCFSCRAHLVGR